MENATPLLDYRCLIENHDSILISTERQHAPFNIKDNLVSEDYNSDIDEMSYTRYTLPSRSMSLKGSKRVDADFKDGTSQQETTQAREREMKHERIVKTVRQYYEKTKSGLSIDESESVQKKPRK